MKDKGFSLLEVLISVIILSSIVVSVLYYFSGTIDNQKKLIEKYKILRICREFIDNFQEKENSGKEEKEGILLEWEVFPVEEARKLIGIGRGINTFLQMKLVHVEIFRVSNRKKLLSLNFITNEFIPVKK